MKQEPKSKGLTVKELLKYSIALYEQGLGDKVVMITSDDEGNEYHTLYYQFTTDVDEIQGVIDAGIVHDDDYYEAEDIVLLG